MALFTSYMQGSAIFCDQTVEETFPDPNSRLLCTQINNQCGAGECDYLIIDNGLVLCNLDNSWNCNLCANDVPFFIPFEENDTFDFQFQQTDYFGSNPCDHGWLPTDLLSPSNTAFASFEIRACCNDAPLTIDQTIFDEIVPNHYVGEFTSTNFAGAQVTSSVQQIRFDLSKIAENMVIQNLDPCFYIIFNFIGTTECLPNTENTNQFFSEPFRALACRERTNVVQSFYPRFDCFGHYYGGNFSAGKGGAFSYSNRIRIPSSFERTNFTITKETIGATLRTTAAQTCENWLLRTPNLPEKFVKYLVNVFAGPNVYVNFETYQIQGDINKNNETGSQWFLEAEFQNCDCDKSLTCS